MIYKVIDLFGNKTLISVNNDLNSILINNENVIVEKVDLSIFSSGRVLNNRKTPRSFLDFSYYIYEIYINNSISFSITNNKNGKDLINKLYAMVKSNPRKKVIYIGKQIEMQTSEFIFLGMKDDKAKLISFEKCEIQLYFDNNMAFPKMIKKIWEKNYTPEKINEDIYPTIGTYKLLNLQNQKYGMILLSVFAIPIVTIMLWGIFGEIRNLIKYQQKISGTAFKWIFILVILISFFSLIVFFGRKMISYKEKEYQTRYEKRKRNF